MCFHNHISLLKVTIIKTVKCIKLNNTRLRLVPPLAQLCKDLLQTFYTFQKCNRNNSLYVSCCPTSGICTCCSPPAMPFLLHLCDVFLLILPDSAEPALPLGSSAWVPQTHRSFFCWAPTAPTMYHEPQHLVGFVGSVSLAFPNTIECEHLNVSAVSDTFQ